MLALYSEDSTPYICQKPVLKITLYYLMWRVLIEVWSLGVNSNTVKIPQNMVPLLTPTSFPTHHHVLRDYTTS
jgi:hypothetical protein